MIRWRKLLTWAAPLCLALAISASAPAQTTWHVDDDAPNDPAPGDPTISDPLEDGSAAHPFDAIQEAMDAAVNGQPLGGLSTRRTKIALGGGVVCGGVYKVSPRWGLIIQGEYLLSEAKMGFYLADLFRSSLSLPRIIASILSVRILRAKNRFSA